MYRMPNILVQLGEALGSGGSLVALLLLCGGAVWVVMSIRRNKDDHDRLEGKIDAWRKEARDEIQAWRKEARDELRAINARLDRIIDRNPPS